MSQPDQQPPPAQHPQGPPAGPPAQYPPARWEPPRYGAAQPAPGPYGAAQPGPGHHGGAQPAPGPYGAAPGSGQYAAAPYGPGGVLPPTVVVAPKSAGVAILLSLLWFGAGHLYANQTGLGVALLVYDFFLLILTVSFFGMIVSVPLWLISLPIVAFTAYNAANEYNRRNGLVVL